MIFAIIVVWGVALTLTGVALWNLYRRRIPDLTQEDLLPDDPMGDNMKVVRKLTDQDKAELYKAFDKSPDFVWILKDGEKLREKLREEEDAEDLQTATSFLLEYCLYIAENYGYIIKSVDQDSRNYQGSIALIPPVTTFRYTAYTFAAMAHVGEPPSCLWDDPNRKARFNAFTGDMDKHHREVMSDCMDDHWYLINLGVAPKAQGKRVGTRLIEQAVHLAGDKPMYVECHNGNVPFYEKSGFKCVKKFPFEPTPKDTTTSTFYYNVLRRDPQ